MSKQITIDIEYALFGNQGNTIDVTKEVQDALMGDDITVSANKLGVEDPAPGETKHFAVKANITIDDNAPYPFYYIGKDYETLDFIP
ncbi:hypothetical protein OAD62_02575 [Oceanihabitans sp.]|jgi:hypothetical protein|nr:hypothetical protein [Oceanihabitans sp.]